MLVIVVGQILRRMTVLMRLPGMLGILVIVIVHAVGIMGMRMAVLVQMVVAVVVGMGVAVHHAVMGMLMGMHVAVLVIVPMLVLVAVFADGFVMHRILPSMVFARTQFSAVPHFRTRIFSF